MEERRFLERARSFDEIICLALKTLHFFNLIINKDRAVTNGIRAKFARVILSYSSSEMLRHYYTSIVDALLTKLDKTNK